MKKEKNLQCHVVAGSLCGVKQHSGVCNSGREALRSTHKGLGLTPHPHRCSHTLTQGMTTPEHPVNDSSVYTRARVETKNCFWEAWYWSNIIIFRGETVLGLFFFFCNFYSLKASCMYAMYSSQPPPSKCFFFFFLCKYACCAGLQKSFRCDPRMQGPCLQSSE